jgi:hypothetical protein
MTSLSLAVESLFSRLSSPAPTTKLLVANHLATLLVNQQTSKTSHEALIKAVREARFESEVTDILSVPLLARGGSIDIDTLRASIQFPSVLSDSMLSLLSGRKFLVNTWISGDSGPAPRIHSMQSLDFLRKAQIIPSFIGHRLANLESESGLPFLRQWCFEFDSLAQRSEEEESSEFRYFSSGDHEYKVGQFVPIASHRARSAYLRTLALAVERWKMPVDTAEFLAAGVRPVEPRLLGFAPTKAPNWCNLLGSIETTREEDWPEKIGTITAGSSKHIDGRILHADFLIAERKHKAVELELVAAFSDREDVEAGEVFVRHDAMPGRWSYNNEDSFTYKTSAEAVPGGKFVLAALPLAGDYLGLFNCDLMLRLPHLPRLFAKTGELRTRSASAQIEIVSGSQVIGKVVYWNRDWSPMHLRYLKPNCGVATTITPEFVSEMESYTRKKLRTFWRLKVVERQMDYGPWDTKKLWGKANPARSL